MKHRKLENSYISSISLELAMLIEAGVTPAHAVLMLHDEEPSREGKAVMKALLEPLDNGRTFTAALLESGYFPRYMINMTEVGEKTGRLTATLRALSAHYDRQERLEATIKNAVLYPLILLIMMVAVVLILVVEVLPIFNDTFNRLGAQMSPLALRFMSFGVWLKDASAAIAIVVGALLLLGVLIWLIPSLRSGAAGVIRKVWGHRGVMGNIASLRFISSMALTTASGLNAEEAVKMASAVSGGTKRLDEKNKRCAELIHEGKTVSEAMYESGIISLRDSRMLLLGSRSGMGDSALAEVAERHEALVQEEIDRIVGRIEPILVAAASVFIGVVLLSVMLPLMGIMSAIE